MQHLLSDATAEFYTPGVVAATGAPAATVNRTLHRLARAGLLDSRLEDPNTPGGRQRRLYFRFARGGALRARLLLPQVLAGPPSQELPSQRNPDGCATQ